MSARLGASQAESAVAAPNANIQASPRSTTSPRRCASRGANTAMAYSAIIPWNGVTTAPRDPP